MILIIVATYFEAKPFLEKYFPNTKLSIGNYIKIKQNVELLITGIGKNFERSLSQIDISKVTAVINIGLAGSLDTVLKRGEIFKIEQVFENKKSLSYKLYEYSFPAKFNCAELETHKFPHLFRTKITKNRLVDMEGFFIVKKFTGVPITIVKVLSDYCSLLSLMISLLFYREKIKNSLLETFEMVVENCK